MSKNGSNEFCIKHILGTNITCQTLETNAGIQGDDQLIENLYRDIDYLFYRMGRNVIINFGLGPFSKFINLRKWYHRYEEKHLVDLTHYALKNREQNNNSENLFIDRVIEMKKNTSIPCVNDFEHVVQMIAAAVDTSTVTLSNIILLLAMYPDAQEKCYKEIKSFWTNSDLDIDMELLSQMKYLQMVIKECMRLIPTAPSVSKQNQDDIELGIKIFNNFLYMLIIYLLLLRCWSHTCKLSYNHSTLYTPSTQRYLGRQC